MTSSPTVSFPRAIFDLFYIPYSRFRPLPLAWGINLVAANMSGLFFLAYLEARVLFLSIVIGLIFMAMVYRRLGFVRLLGAGHALWVFVVPWFIWRLINMSPGGDSFFQIWLLWVTVTDGISLVIDIRDVWLFVRGERSPYY